MQINARPPKEAQPGARCCGSPTDALVSPCTRALLQMPRNHARLAGHHGSPRWPRHADSENRAVTSVQDDVMPGNMPDHNTRHLCCSPTDHVVSPCTRALLKMRHARVAGSAPRSPHWPRHAAESPASRMVIDVRPVNPIAGFHCRSPTDMLLSPCTRALLQMPMNRSRAASRVASRTASPHREARPRADASPASPRTGPTARIDEAAAPPLPPARRTRANQTGSAKGSALSVLSFDDPSPCVLDRAGSESPLSRAPTRDGRA